MNDGEGFFHPLPVFFFEHTYNWTYMYVCMCVRVVYRRLFLCQMFLVVVVVVGQPLNTGGQRESGLIIG